MPDVYIYWCQAVFKLEVEFLTIKTLTKNALAHIFTFFVLSKARAAFKTSQNYRKSLFSSCLKLKRREIFGKNRNIYDTEFLKNFNRKCSLLRNALKLSACGYCYL